VQARFCGVWNLPKGLTFALQPISGVKSRRGVCRSPDPATDGLTDTSALPALVRASPPCYRGLLRMRCLGRKRKPVHVSSIEI
jgi:hypothetical protein